MGAITAAPIRPSVSEDAPAAGEDGRRLRRARNRDAVVDALLDLYRSGNLRPSSAEIAEKAGLSARSLFRYFEDIDDLCRAAVTRQQQRSAPLLSIDAGAGDPLPVRIAALIDQRIRLFRAVAPAATISRIGAPFQPALAEGLAEGRSFLRRQVRQLFASELSAMDGARAASVLASADVLCSFESFSLLRDDQHLTLQRTRQALEGALTTLLATAK